MSILASIERFESGSVGAGSDAQGFADVPPAFSRTTRYRRATKGYKHPYTQRAGFASAPEFTLRADFLDASGLNPKQMVKDAIETATKEIKDFYTEGMKKIKEGLKDVFDNLRKELSDALDTIKTKAKDEFNAIVEKIKTAINTLKDKAIEEYNVLREKAEAAFNKLKDAAKAELIVVKDELQKVYSKVKDVAGQQMNAVKDVILEAVRPTVHKYVPPVITVAGLTAFVAVSEIPPIKMLGPIMGNLFSWTILLLFLYVAYFTWLSTAGPQDTVAKFMGGPDLARRVGFLADDPFAG
jgi:ElaB/YqjD/DUF883 family membrane-anchored ribosome-binding protein